MKTECKNNSYNTFPSSIALINLENSRVQVCFFYWHFSTDIPFIYYAHEFQVSFDTITFDPTSISTLSWLFLWL